MFWICSIGETNRDHSFSDGSCSIPTNDLITVSKYSKLLLAENNETIACVIRVCVLADYDFTYISWIIEHEHWQ